MAFASVIVSITHKNVDSVFSYSVPNDMEISVGDRVMVPFGGGNRKTEGYVIALEDAVDYPAEKIKPILKVIDEKPVFTETMIELAKWMKQKYYTTLSECLQCIMPAGIKLKSDYILEFTGTGDEKLSPSQQKLVSLFGQQKTLSLNELVSEFGEGMSRAATALVTAGVIKKTQRAYAKDYILRVKYVSINDGRENLEQEMEEIISKDNAQARTLSFLLSNGSTRLADLKQLLRISGSPVQTLKKREIIVVEDVEIRKDPLAHYPEKQESTLTLTPEQENALEYIKKSHETGKNTVLLHGVTGSGKTEIYLRLIEHVLSLGKQAVMLVPEISLTPQTVDSFLMRFGNAVTVTHSRLSAAERMDQWRKARDGQIQIMVGPRSAIFSPFSNLGIIIIDEEHEHTYKSETTPKYSVKEVAGELSRLTGCMVVLGSATPSLETNFEAESNRIGLVKMKERVNKRMPGVNIVDMRYELANGNKSMFSRDLQEALKQNLELGEQSILFLNRRGHSTFVSCRTCGHVMSCGNCNINYTYHKISGRLICHYCGAAEPSPVNCPVCGSKYIKYFGMGTQKIEEEVLCLLPGARTIRMDFDTTRTKNGHEKIIRMFAEKKADILIGTQMIAKGLNFPNISLVGIVAADLSLNTGDFRSAEKTFQLLTQVSGRAGRADIPGRVYIQTYAPTHYSILCARDGDYERFYRTELEIRRQMVYPPFSHFFTVLFTGKDEKTLILTMHKLLAIMKFYNRENRFELLGPAPAAVSKLKSNYRWKIIVKCTDEERLKNFVLYCMSRLAERVPLDGIYSSLSLDPQTTV